MYVGEKRGSMSTLITSYPRIYKLRRTDHVPENKSKAICFGLIRRKFLACNGSPVVFMALIRTEGIWHSPLVETEPGDPGELGEFSQISVAMELFGNESFLW